MTCNLETWRAYSETVPTPKALPDVDMDTIFKRDVLSLAKGQALASFDLDPVSDA